MSKPNKMTSIYEGTHDGIEWAVCHAPLYGASNGYVRVPEGHAWHGLDYEELPTFYDVHELTYGRDGWIGFDTLHICDSWPGAPDFWDGPHKWTHELVREETLRLAAHVKAAS